MTVTNVHKDPEALTMTITTELAASPERAWRLWADPRQLERWWGPPTYPATFVDHDLSPGGRVSYYMTSPEGEKYHGWWEVLATEPPRRIEAKDGFGESSDKPTDDMPGPSSMTVTFDEIAGGTVMTITSRFESTESMEKMLEMGMEEGMSQALGQIDAILAAA